MAKTVIRPSLWDAKIKRRQEFCARFVAEHHPGMTVELVPLGPARRFNCDIRSSNWWFHTDDSMCALGGVYLGYLFDKYHMLDHDWLIGPRKQEPWALVSEPYNHTKQTIAKLRSEMEAVGVELIAYPSEASTHAPGSALMLVANVDNIHLLMGAVAREIAAACGPANATAP